MFYRGLHGRVTKLENDVAMIGTDVKDVQTVVGGLGGKIDKLVDGLSNTDGRAAERAHAVKIEMREEGDRKSKERTSAAMIAFGLLSAIALIVAALTGPWKEKLESTSNGQNADSARISEVREVLAQQGAAIGRAQAGLDIARDKGAQRDDELRQHDQELFYMKGVMAAKGWPTK